VYALDYAALAEEHREAGADVTLTTTEVDPEDAGRYGVVQAQGGRVTDYVYKPDEPEGALVSNEVFVFSPGRTLDLLDELAGSAGEEGLQDLGNELLPRLVDAGAAHEHRFGGYWRDVGTIDAYWSAHQELVDGETETLDLDDQAWPILTRGIDRRGAALVLPGAEVEASLLAAGTRIAGTVERSVIGRGGTVEEGATVRGAVVLPGATVRAGARVEHAIIDEGVEVGRDAVVGEHGGAIALVGLRAKVEEGARLPAGARMPELDR
jgi:glucose-1-phosphate adenylyltransferase